MAQNLTTTLLASAARTATTSSAAQINRTGRGVRVSINVTVHAVSAAIVPTIEVKDPVSGVWTAVLTGAAITGVAHVELIVYPGATAAANLVASIPLGREWRVTMTPGNANSATYSVGATLLV